MMTDRELVNRVLRDGQRQCFADIVSRYSGMVFSKALGIVKREELACEVSQQTFVKAYTRLQYWRTDSLGPWLAAIAMHTALNELERERRQRKYLGEYAETGRGGEHSSSAVDLAADRDLGEREALLQRMEQAIDELPEQDREIIRLHYYEQRKTDDIARQTGLSQANVLVRLHRIRDRLRKKLSP